MVEAMLGVATEIAGQQSVGPILTPKPGRNPKAESPSPFPSVSNRAAVSRPELTLYVGAETNFRHPDSKLLANHRR